MKIIQGLPGYVAPNHYVCLDVELFQAEAHRLHRPNTGSFAALSICSEGDPDTAYVVTDKHDVREALERCKDGVWVAHNLQFDLVHLRRWADIPPRKKVWCTSLIEQTLWGGYFPNFPKLDDLARRYRGKKLQKDVRETFETASTLTLDQINYAADDAREGLLAALEQRKLVQNGRSDVWDVWMSVDMPCMWAFLDFRGFRIDADMWMELAAHNKLMAERCKQELEGVLPSSPKQVKEKLHELGWKVPSTGAEVLEGWLARDNGRNPKALEFAQTVLDYRGYSKLSSTYGTNFVENYLEYEDIDGEQIAYILACYNVIGARTGRTSVSKPSKQNIPVRKYPEFRKPWIARPGNKLVVIDWSSQEPRIHAFLCEDENLLNIFKERGNPYIQTVKRLYGRDITKQDDAYRDIKDDFLGAIYGMSPYGLAKRRNISKDDAKKRLDTFFSGFPGSQRWVERQKRKKDYVETLSGRRVWLNPYITKSERQALNSPHQAPAADMLKKTIAQIYFNWDWDYPFSMVEETHDEFILDVPEKLAPEVAKWAEEIAISVSEEMCDNQIPFSADPTICDNWLEAK